MQPRGPLLVMVLSATVASASARLLEPDDVVSGTTELERLRETVRLDLESDLKQLIDEQPTYRATTVLAVTSAPFIVGGLALAGFGASLRNDAVTGPLALVAAIAVTSVGGALLIVAAIAFVVTYLGIARNQQRIKLIRARLDELDLSHPVAPAPGALLPAMPSFEVARF